MLRNYFVNLKKGTEFLNYGRHILRAAGVRYAKTRIQGNPSGEIRILDLGCGHGTDLRNIREEIHSVLPEGAGWKIQLFGVENYGPYVEECELSGIRVRSLDVERDPFPGDGAPYDLILANQILEHTKEIFWIFSEAARLLAPGGRFIVGVPNLASLHNRILLLFGQQPTAIQALSAHVRGFTYHDLKRFGEEGGYFRVVARSGSNFYPFPVPLAKILARLFPSMAWALFMEFERTSREGSFLDCLKGDQNFLETPFYGSPQNPAPETMETNRAERIAKKTAGKKNPGSSSRKKTGGKGI